MPGGFAHLPPLLIDWRNDPEEAEMKAVVFLGDRKIDFMEFPDPTPSPGEAVIEIKAFGMCGSDLKMYRAKGGVAALGLVGDGSPLVAGHEPCGVVAAVGEGVPEALAKAGDRVMDHHYSGSSIPSMRDNPVPNVGGTHVIIGDEKPLKMAPPRSWPAPSYSHEAPSRSPVYLKNGTRLPS